MAALHALQNEKQKPARATAAARRAEITSLRGLLGEYLAGVVCVWGRECDSTKGHGHAVKVVRICKSQFFLRRP
jgi:hypothetical protein